MALPYGVNADLEDASRFAWEQFIAMNWPADCSPATSGQNCTRDKAYRPSDASALGANSSRARVWQTFRHKTEVYANGHSFTRTPYSTLPAQYWYTGEYPNSQLFQAEKCGGGGGQVSPSFTNLDETSQIGQNEMFAGIVKPWHDWSWRRAWMRGFC